MNNYIYKVFTAILALSLTTTPVLADGLVDGNVSSIDNNGSFVNKVNGIDFNLNGGLTNINWDKMNVAGNETLNFNFNVGNSTAFNYVNSLNGPSTIAGSINALGAGASTSNIIISNNAGVTFANGAVVNVGAMSVLSQGNIDVNRLTVRNGNLNFESTKLGDININGIKYDKAGDLTVATKNGDISVANVLAANKIDLTAKKGNIYLGGGTTMVGGKHIDGITSEYLALNAENGKVNVTGKVTVGQDFNIIAKTNDGIHFDNAKVNTKHGSFELKNDNAKAVIAFADSSIKAIDGKIKLVAKNIDMIDSRFDNVEIASAKNINIDNSIITNILIKEVENLVIKNINAKADTLTLNDIKVTGKLTSDKSLLVLNNADINNAEFIGGNLVADNSSFNVLKAGINDPLWSDNVAIKMTDSQVYDLQAQGHIIDLVNTAIANATLDSVTLTAISNNGKPYSIENIALGGGSVTTEGYVLNNVSLKSATANLKNSTATAINADVNSSVKADASTITTINSINSKFRNLELANNAKVKNLNVKEITNVKLSNVTRALDNLKIDSLISTRSTVSMNNTTVRNAEFTKGSLVANNINSTGDLNIGNTKGNSDDLKATISNSNVNNINTNGTSNNIILNNTNVKGTLNSTQAKVTAESSDRTHNINSIAQTSGSVILNNYNVGSINSDSATTYANGTLNITNSIINNLKTNLLYTVAMKNSKLNNAVAINANTLILNDMNATLADGSRIGGYIAMENSNLTANNLYVVNCIDAKGGSLNLSNSTIAHHLIMDDTSFNFNNTGVNMNIYYTKSSNNNIIASEVTSLVNALNKPDSNLYIGYTPNMGDYKDAPVSMNSTFAGNVEANGSMMNKGVKIATLGDVNLNISNVRSLAIDNSKSSIVEYSGDLHLDQIIAIGNIELTADSLINSISKVGTIDSKSDTITLNIAKGLTNLGSAIDLNSRGYNVLASGSNTYNVYNGVSVVNPSTPIDENVSSTLTNYVSTLKVNTDAYNLPNQPQTLAGQFAKNVRSLAVDSDATKSAVLSEIKNGFRLESKIMP